MKKLDLNILKRDLTKYSDKEVLVGGWVRSVRDMKTFGFMDLNDGTSFKGLQVVLNADVVKIYDRVQ